MFPQTLEQATALVELIQALMSAATAEELLRAFVRPLWLGEACYGGLFYIETHFDDNAEAGLQIIASIEPPHTPESVGVVGNRYRKSDFPIVRAFLSNPDNLQYYDVDTDVRVIDENAIGWFQERGIRSIGAIALRASSGQTVGLAVNYWAERRPFSEEERRLYEQLSPTMARLLENHWNSEQRDLALRLAEALYRANRALVRADSYAQILNAVFRYAEQTGASVASMSEVEIDDTGKPDWTTVVARAGTSNDVGAPVGARFHLPDIPFSHLWTDQPEGIVLVSDTQNDTRIGDKTRALMRQSGIRATVVMPLTRYGTWIGVLSINWSEVHLFSAIDERFYRSLSTQVATALDNLRLRKVEQQALQKLAEQEALYRLLAENVSDVITLNGADWVYTYVSPSCKQVLGYEPEELIGKSPSTLMHADDIQSVNTGFLEATDMNGYFQSRLRMRRREGYYIWVEATTRILREPDGSIRESVSVVRDITRRKESEDAIEQLNSDLRAQTAQLAATNRELEAFTYSVSHDLRAPLRAMDGFSKILSEKYRDGIPEEGRRYLDRVRANAVQMGKLIDDLLTLSRVGKRALEVRLVDMKQTAAAAAREVIGDEDDFPVQLVFNELPNVEGDPGLLKQVFVNLFSNAVKFSQERPNPTIEVGVSGEEQGFPVYFVRDNGIGFDMQYADKVFGVFQRLHDPRQYEGTGVGLAIVYRIISRHGGRIWVESEPGRGTTFYFTTGGRDAGSIG